MAFNADFCPNDAYTVTTSDTTINPGIGFMVGTGGDVAVRTGAGTTVTLKGCAAGIQYAIKFDRVMTTNTSASNIVAFKG